MSLLVNLEVILGSSGIGGFDEAPVPEIICGMIVFDAD